MTDNLRDRIAAAIYSMAMAWDDFPYEELSDHVKDLYRSEADAVIAALGLRNTCGCVPIFPPKADDD
jgi:hypothetical protein